MGHLKRMPSGHLAKSIFGHLALDCEELFCDLCSTDLVTSRLVVAEPYWYWNSSFYSYGFDMNQHCTYTAYDDSRFVVPMELLSAGTTASPDGPVNNCLWSAVIENFRDFVHVVGFLFLEYREVPALSEYKWRMSAWHYGFDIDRFSIPGEPGTPSCWALITGGLTQEAFYIKAEYDIPEDECVDPTTIDPDDWTIIDRGGYMDLGGVGSTDPDQMKPRVWRCGDSGVDPIPVAPFTKATLDYVCTEGPHSFVPCTSCGSSIVSPPNNWNGGAYINYPCYNVNFGCGSITPPSGWP